VVNRAQRISEKASIKLIAAGFLRALYTNSAVNREKNSSKFTKVLVNSYNAQHSYLQDRF